MLVLVSYIRKENGETHNKWLPCWGKGCSFLMFGMGWEVEEEEAGRALTGEMGRCLALPFSGSSFLASETGAD